MFLTYLNRNTSLRIRAAHRLSRRKFICNGLGYIVTTVGVGGLFACAEQANESQTDCDNLKGLSRADLKIRSQLGYVKQSSFLDRTCDNCQLFVKGDTSLPCGSCLVMKGPVMDSGYCTVWAPVERLTSGLS